LISARGAIRPGFVIFRLVKYKVASSDEPLHRLGSSDCFFLRRDEEAFILTLAVLPDHIVAHAITPRNSEQGRRHGASTLRWAPLARRRTRRPIQEGSDGRPLTSHRRAGIIGCFGEMAKQQFEWHQEDDPGRMPRIWRRGDELGKRQQRIRTPACPKIAPDERT